MSPNTRRSCINYSENPLAVPCRGLIIFHKGGPKMDDKLKDQNELSLDELEHIAGGGAYGNGTNIYMTVHTKGGGIPLLAAPDRSGADELAKLYTGDKVELVRPYDAEFMYVFDIKTGQYGYVEGNCLVESWR